MDDIKKLIFDKGYTDAYYGKDKSDLYDGLEYLIYQQGQEQFLKEFEETGQ